MDVNSIRIYDGRDCISALGLISLPAGSRHLMLSIIDEKLEFLNPLTKRTKCRKIPSCMSKGSEGKIWCKIFVNEAFRESKIYFR